MKTRWPNSKNHWTHNTNTFQQNYFNQTHPVYQSKIKGLVARESVCMCVRVWECFTGSNSSPAACWGCSCGDGSVEVKWIMGHVWASWPRDQKLSEARQPMRHAWLKVSLSPSLLPSLGKELKKDSGVKGVDTLSRREKETERACYIYHAVPCCFYLVC